MKALTIVNCSDGMMWYCYNIGQMVPYLGEEDDVYWSREPDGYRNIILKKDAVVVEIDDTVDLAW